jgi:tetratricopeptide (TPR) repeat protein
LAYAGRTETAREYAMEASSLDPLSWLTTHPEPVAELFAGNPEAAFEAIKDLARRFAIGEPWPAFEVGYAALQADRKEEARDWFRKSMESETPLYSRLGSAFFYLTNDDFEKAENALEPEGLSRIAGRIGYTSYMMGSIYAGVGKIDKALAWLECAVKKGFLNHPFMSEHDLLLVSLRDDPRFEALVDEARKKEAALVV